MGRVLTGFMILMMLCNILLPAEAEPLTRETATLPEILREMTLKLVPQTPVSFTNALYHYVYFDAEVQGVEKLVIRVLDPEGKPTAFRNRRRVDKHISASKSASSILESGQKKCEGLNVLFQSGLHAGTWIIEVTACASEKKSVVQTISVEIRNPDPLKLRQLPKVHEMLTGIDGEETVPAEPGRIRYIAQDPRDTLFVREYWVSKAFDLRDKANQQCTRAVFSMALSWLGIDCTPVRMSEMLRSEEIFYTYDEVCETLGNVVRKEGDLESLWERYQEGKASPVQLHFQYEDGMHSVLLAARDEENPELFYAVTTGQQANTSSYPDGKPRDMVIPILIEKGEIGQQIQSPLLKRYHKGVIDQIWQWERTD